MSPGVGTGAANTATARARGLGVIPPQSLQNVQISAINGTVTLSGSVNNEAERRLLENRIRRMAGVTTVQNNLTVAGAPGQVDRGQGTGIGTTTGTGTGTGVGTPNTGAGTIDQNASRPGLESAPQR